VQASNLQIMAVMLQVTFANQKYAGRVFPQSKAPTQLTRDVVDLVVRLLVAQALDKGGC
jgi:hypothetical protein